MIKNKDIKIDPSQDSSKNGDLISRVLISAHGLNFSRFINLPYEERLYCLELLTIIVQKLDIHLSTLKKFIKDFPIYPDKP